MSIFAELGNVAKQFIEKGSLVPDDLVLKLVLAELVRADDRPWMLDGERFVFEQVD